MLKCESFEVCDHWPQVKKVMETFISERNLKHKDIINVESGHDDGWWIRLWYWKGTK